MQDRHAPAPRAAAAMLLGLALLTLIPYGQTVFFDFIAWDDGQYVTENERVQRGLTWPNAGWAFSTGYGGTWQPLDWLSHMLDIELYGLWPGGHHLTNVLFHIANTLLVFGLMRRLLQGPARAVYWEAGFIAAVFAVHPLHVESVAWVSERKDVLSGMFFLLALLAYVAYGRRPSVTRYVWTAVAFAFGLMSKPMVVTLPAVMLLLDYWPLGRMTDWRSAVRLAREKAPFFAMSAAAAVVTVITQARSETVSGLERVSLAMRASNVLTGYVRYLGKTLWPADLAAHYPFPADPIPLWQTAGALALLLAVTAGALVLARRAPWLVTGWLYYLVTLLPVIGIIQVGSQAIADRYMYLPMLGLLIMAGRAGSGVAMRGESRRKAVAALAVLIVAGLTLLCVCQTRLWRDTFTLFRASAERVPESGVAQFKTGYAYHEQGELAKAAYHMRRALEIGWKEPAVRTQYGRLLIEQGRVREALDVLAEGYRRFPAEAELRDNLAAALLHAGRYALAEELLRKAARENPEDPLLLTNLGAAVAEQGRLEEAGRLFRQALKVNPDYERARQALAHYAP